MFSETQLHMGMRRSSDVCFKVSEHSLRALYDLYCWRKLAHALSFKKNKHGTCTAIISFCSVKIVQVFFFSVLTIKQFVMSEKRLFFNVLKVILNCLSKIACMDLEPSQMQRICAVNQKIVTVWFRRNALISKEPLVRISWNSVE